MDMLGSGLRGVFLDRVNVLNFSGYMLKCFYIDKENFTHLNSK